MSDIEFHLLIPPDVQFFTVEEIPWRTAGAMCPQTDDEPWESTARRIECSGDHKRHLNDAIVSEVVTPLNPLSYAPERNRDGKVLERAVIARSEFEQFARSLFIAVDTLDEPPVNAFGYTLRGAAKALAEKSADSESAFMVRLKDAKEEGKANEGNTERAWKGWLLAPAEQDDSERAWRNRLLEAAELGEIVFKDPRTGQPYIPYYARDYYVRVSCAELNTWLEQRRVEYRLDPNPSATTRDAQSNDTDNPAPAPVAALTEDRRDPASGEMKWEAPNPIAAKILKRSLMLDELSAKYPKLANAIGNNDPAFLRCRVPPEDAPGNKQGYYYLELVEAACAQRWSPEEPPLPAPPSIQKLGNF